MASARKAGGASKVRRARSAKPRVAVLMGSKSDWELMKLAVEALDLLGVACDVRVISAHRTPERHRIYVTGAEERGIEIFICGAGLAAHLAGVTAALTPLPVLGVPLDGSSLNGVDALLSMVQMPGGIPGHLRNRQGRGQERRSLRRRNPGGEGPEGAQEARRLAQEADRGSARDAVLMSGQ